MSDQIDKIIYINLDKRQDRRIEMEAEIEKMKLVDKTERFPAIEMSAPHGILGCGKSHLAVLKLAKERGYKRVLILEDDFTFFISHEEFEQSLTDLFQEGPPFDVCFLSCRMEEGSVIENTPQFSKVGFATTASSYIVQEHYYDKLINLYEWAMPLLESTCEHWNYANDQVWRTLQQNDQWICFTNRLGKQRAGFSDNTQSVIDRGV